MKWTWIVRRWIMGLVMAGCAFMPVAHGMSISPELQGVLQQVHVYYLAPQGLSVLGAERHGPMVLAVCLGHALQQQARHASHTALDPRRLDALVLEAERYLRNLASIYASAPGYRDRGDGQPVAFSDLRNALHDGLSGQANAYILDQYGVHIGMTPPILWQSPPVAPGREPDYLRFGTKPPTPPPGLNLLGVKPGASTYQGCGGNPLCDPR